MGFSGPFTYKHVYILSMFDLSTNQILFSIEIDESLLYGTRAQRLTPFPVFKDLIQGEFLMEKLCDSY